MARCVTTLVIKWVEDAGVVDGGVRSDIKPALGPATIGGQGSGRQAGHGFLRQRVTRVELRKQLNAVLQAEVEPQWCGCEPPVRDHSG
jgi:hypothetical protein